MGVESTTKNTSLIETLRYSDTFLQEVIFKSKPKGKPAVGQTKGALCVVCAHVCTGLGWFKCPRQKELQVKRMTSQVCLGKGRGTGNS